MNAQSSSAGFQFFSEGPFEVSTGGNAQVKMAVDESGIITLNSLAGTGTRNVVVDANGVMSAP